MEQIERIAYFENLMNEAEAVTGRMEDVLRLFQDACRDLENVQGKMRELDAYLSSAEWREDYEASENGALPEGMPCGVLSEDGLYNLLETNRELLDEVFGGSDGREV